MDPGPLTRDRAGEDGGRIEGMGGSVGGGDREGSRHGCGRAVCCDTMDGLDLLSHVAAETWSNRNESPSFSVAVDAPTSKLGDLKCTLTPNNTCAESRHTGVHLERERGRMHLNLALQTTRKSRRLKIRAVLLRAHDNYRHLVVDRVCPKHVGNCPKGTEDQVLAPGREGEGISFGEPGDLRRSVTWMTWSNDRGLMNEDICLLSRCTDTCQTSTRMGQGPPEASRDLLLVLTVEDTQEGQVIARESLRFWPKAKLATRELHKLVRRLYKGAPQPFTGTDKQEIKLSLRRAIRVAKQYNMGSAEFEQLMRAMWDSVPSPAVAEHAYGGADGASS